MKTLFLSLLSVLLLPATLPAQNAPTSGTLTSSPRSMTFKSNSSSQKFPVPARPTPPIGSTLLTRLSLPCLLTSGKPRPFACEFSFDKLEFYGNDGLLLATVNPDKGQPPLTQLPFGKAKNSAPAGQTGQITYTAKAYFTRRNKPAFPVNKGYQIRSCPVSACLQSDNISPVLSGITMPAGLLDKAVRTFDLSWVYSKKDGLMIGPHELYIENDVTTTKFPLTSSVTLHDKSEAWLRINPAVTGEPSPNK